MAGGGLGMMSSLGAGSAPAPSADDLLVQIQALLGQYLALGPDTPVAAEAQGLMAAIDSQTGAGEAAGAPGAAGPADPSGSLTAQTPMDAVEPNEGTPAEEASPEDLTETNSTGDSYKDTRPGAKAFLKGKNKAKAK